MAKLTRRLLLGAAVAAPLAYVATNRPKPAGGAHDDYFLGLQKALRSAGLHRPTLVVDRDRLRRNVGRLKQHLPKNFQFRIVAKSLPSLPLLQLVREEMQTNRLMVFHQPHLNLLAVKMPDAHQLVGKPMPIGAAQRFYEKLPAASAFDPSTQLEWLVDTPERLREYREFAMLRRAQGAGPMALNLELDVGLRRGGFRSAQAVAEAIRAIRAEPALRFAGFMGYEAHAAKMPEFLGGARKALDTALAFYGECVEAARAERKAAGRVDWAACEGGAGLGGVFGE